MADPGARGLHGAPGRFACCQPKLAHTQLFHGTCRAETEAQPEGRDKALRATGCATAHPALLTPFDPGSDPRGGKGCVQEVGLGVHPMLIRGGLGLSLSAGRTPQTPTWRQSPGQDLHT